ncbi:MAG: response regulator transcription factor [Bryobacteraceae bacterium]
MSHELTPREIDVVRLVASGMGDKEIGHALGISGITARNHLQAIRQKLGLANRTQLAVYAIRTGLVAPPAREGTPTWLKS